MNQVKATQFAQQGLDFVTLFSAKFANKAVSGYLPVLREPLDTTAGGKQAVQHMVFEPQIDGDPVLTVGYVNVVTKTAKLRTFDCLEEMFLMRFPKRTFHLDARQYQEFFDVVAKFMRRQGMQIQIETRPPVSRSSRPPAQAKSIVAELLLWLMVVVLVAGGTAAVYMRVTGKL
ncbi:MAG: hypothetical protein R3B72_00465 [Polyangiaceae bacterium]